MIYHKLQHIHLLIVNLQADSLKKEHSIESTPLWHSLNKYWTLGPQSWYL